MKKTIIFILSVILMIAASVCIVRYYQANHGFSDWMYPHAFGDYLKSHDGDGTWISAAEGRWYDGSWQMRARFEPAPTGPHAMYWWFNMTPDFYFKQTDKLADDGFTQVYYQDYKWPDGSILRQGVWHKSHDLMK